MEQAEARTHAMRAVIALRRRIISGELAGGTRLYEVPLAEQLDISRTPVREAMSRLVEEGLLERGHNGGVTVRSFSFADVIDFIEMRGVMEGAAARLAAERGVPSQKLATVEKLLDRLDTCFGSSDEDVDFERYSELNAEFHAELARLCGSRIIEQEVRRASQLPFASPSAFLPDKTRIAAFRRSLKIAQDQHRCIFSAIVAREGSRAEAVAREHARSARGNLEYLMAEGRNLIPDVPELALVVD